MKITITQSFSLELDADEWEMLRLIAAMDITIPQATSRKDEMRRFLRGLRVALQET